MLPQYSGGANLSEDAESLGVDEGWLWQYGGGANLNEDAESLGVDEGWLWRPS